MDSCAFWIPRKLSHLVTLSQIPRNWTTLDNKGSDVYLARGIPAFYSFTVLNIIITPAPRKGSEAQRTWRHTPDPGVAGSPAGDANDWRGPISGISYTHAHLTTGLCSEKCVTRWFCRCANATERTYTNLDGVACHNLGCTVQPIAPRLQTCTVCYCAKQHGIKPRTRQNDAIKRLSKHRCMRPLQA